MMQCKWMSCLIATIVLYDILGSAFVQGSTSATAFAPIRKNDARPSLQVRNKKASFQTLKVASIPDIAASYDYALQHHHLLTVSVTSALISSLGDVLAQVRSATDQLKDDGDVDVAQVINSERMLQFLFKGLIGGLIWEGWYNLADSWSEELAHQLLPNMIAANDAASFEAVVLTTILSILLEQFVGCPAMYSAWDIPVTAIMRGATLASVPTHVKRKLGPILLENAKVWTLANIVIYNIPLQYRVVVMSLADIIWQSILSGIANRDLETPQPPTTLLLPPSDGDVDGASLAVDGPVDAAIPRRNTV